MGHSDDGVVVAHPTHSAGEALAPRTDLETVAFLAEILAADDAAPAIAMLAIQPVSRRRSVLFFLSPPRIYELVVEQVAESLEVQLFPSPHRRIMMFVFERFGKQGLYTFLTA